MFVLPLARILVLRDCTHLQETKSFSDMLVYVRFQPDNNFIWVFLDISTLLHTSKYRESVPAQNRLR